MKIALAIALLLVPLAAEATCTVTVTPIVFGRYDVFDEAPLTAAGTVVYECASSIDRLRIRIAPSAGSSARTHGLKNGDSSISESVISKAPPPPGIHVSPAGSGLGLGHFVVSMICTTRGASGGDTAVATATSSNVALAVILLSRTERADGWMPWLASVNSFLKKSLACCDTASSSIDLLRPLRRGFMLI